MSNKVLSNDSILQAIESMSAIELMDLVKAIEEKFGVSAAAVASGPVASSDDSAGKAEEKTQFKVVIKDVGGNTIAVIKALRAVLPGLGLTEAKAMAVPAAVVKEDVSKDEAVKIEKALKEAGATVSIE